MSALSSIADLQLQPVTVVTREAYHALYPDDGIETRYVVVNGCRRLAAAREYGRSGSTSPSMTPSPEAGSLRLRGHR